MTNQLTPSDARPALRRRASDTPLTELSARRGFAAFASFIRLRCPHCRRGAVLRGWYGMHERCPVCQFRYERSDENYFQGAMFINFMLGGFTFAVSMLGILMMTWPDVPWNALTFGTPVGIVVYMVLLYPISKVAWLTVDVMLRPVTAEEREPDTSDALPSPGASMS